MDDREFEKILASAEQLRLREKQAEPWTDRYSDMNSMEKSMLLDELFALRKADKEERDRLLEKLDRMTEQLMNLNESSQMQMKQNEELKQMIADLQKQNELLKKENAALKEQKKQDRKNLYGSKSQKISRKKKEEAPSHEENKDDFDGTSGPSSVSASDEDALSQAPEKKEERPYRKGMSYKRMKADKSVCHDSDFSRLPKDAVIIKTFYKYSYQQISYILEHKYQVIRYKQSDGKIFESYLSKDHYDIDNSIAERFIRPLAAECKNSLFFVGSRMANVSAAYHTLLSTCRMNGLSALEYLKKFFHEIVKGRKDYENLLPMTIGINTNRC